MTASPTVVWLLLLLLVPLLLYVSGCVGVAATSFRCQQRLNEWCNDVSVPAVASCYKTMKADGYKLPLYARFDTDAQHGADAWRCYSPSSLTPSLKHYSTGIAYCTHEATLAALAWDCEHNVTNLFPAGARGVHEYRIPLLLNIESASSAACGTLLAFAEARIFSSSDRGPKHIAMRRSTDCGVTWDPIQFIVSDNSTDPSYDGLNLGSAVYDAATHTVTVVFVECAHSCKVAPLYTIASTDSGSTWAASGNLTDAMLAGGVRLFAPGPGTGLVLPQASGATRLLIPGWFRPTNSGQYLAHVTAWCCLSCCDALN